MAETKEELRARLARHQASRRVTRDPRRDPFWGRWVPRVHAAMRPIGRDIRRPA